MKLRSLLLLACCLTLVDASAQRVPGRDRGESPRDMPRKEQPASSRTSMPSDPFSALEREMPSLKTDLQLKGDQSAAWQVFERDVRGLAEMGRQRTRFLMALRDPGDKPLPTASDLLGHIDQEDRRRADATADLKRHFEALYATLDDAQRRMIDRRIVLSQTEPLGQETPPKR
jgi:hypothetical protein